MVKALNGSQEGKKKLVQFGTWDQTRTKRIPLSLNLRKPKAVGNNIEISFGK